MVEVEERALGSLEEDMLAAREGGLDQPGRIVEVGSQPFAPADGVVDERIDRERLRAHRREQEVLVGEQAPEPLAEHGRVEQVLHPQAQPPGAVGVGRPDAAPGRPHLGAVEPRLVGPVEREVVRHDHVRAPADADPAHVDAA